jgi:hypothetical protein
MLHRIKGIFGADHVPVVSSGHSGFKSSQVVKNLLFQKHGKIFISSTI